jgi:heme/copper-type cytochrome/quinol oxidase subunit 3
MTLLGPPRSAEPAVSEPPTPRVTRRSYSTAWWGMIVLISTEGMVFAILIAAYMFLRASSKHWPPPGTELPELPLTLAFSVVLWGSSVPIFWAEAAIQKGKQASLRAGLLISFVMGLSFLAYTGKDFMDLHYGWRDSAYASIFYVIVGLHGIHVVIGLAMNLVVQIKAWQAKFTAHRHTTVEVFSLYWHFVDVVWLFVMPTVFLSPHVH